MTKVKLDIANIKQEIGLSEFFSYEELLDATKLSDDIILQQCPTKVEGSITQTSNRIFQVVGNIIFKAKVKCYRCLEKTSVDLDIEFDFKFTDSKDESTDKEDIFCFSGDIIELEPYIIGEIILNWPSQVLCKPDCKGLCPKCGIDLNKSTCDCEKKAIDPRLAVLKKLLK